MSANDTPRTMPTHSDGCGAYLAAKGHHCDCDIAFRLREYAEQLELEFRTMQRAYHTRLAESERTFGSSTFGKELQQRVEVAEKALAGEQAKREAMQKTLEYIAAPRFIDRPLQQQANLGFHYEKMAQDTLAAIAAASKGIR